MPDDRIVSPAEDDAITSEGEAITFARRWKARRHFKVRSADQLFHAREFGVEIISDRRLAKPFVLAEHYSGSYPASRAAFGLFRKTGVAPAELAGVAVISVPMNQHAVPRYLGLEPNAGAEIGRFVLKEDVAFNGESWFLARMRKLLREHRPEIRGLISYADPLERTDAAGNVSKRAHWGQIYAASNASYVGRSSKRILILAPDGSILSERMLAKIRNEERGHDYAMRQFIAAGAESREVGESSRDWVTRALRSPSFRRLRHPGNHVYLFGLDRQTVQRIKLHNPVRHAYPKPARVPPEQHPETSSWLSATLPRFSMPASSSAAPS